MVKDITCASCFSSSLGAVTVTQSQAKCPICLCLIDTFEAVTLEDIAKLQLSSKEYSMTKLLSLFKRRQGVGPVVMRIDNVAWAGITDKRKSEGLTILRTSLRPPLRPFFREILYLVVPFNQSISSLTGLMDVLRTIWYAAFKDCCSADYSLRKQYIEASTLHAAQTILKTCQNTFMPGGALTSGRERPVTITPVSHAELIEELRPRSAQELHSLLALCQASVGSGSASKQSTSKYVKSRHGPYYALISTMSKLNGEQSPSYWDLFCTWNLSIIVESPCTN